MKTNGLALIKQRLSSMSPVEKRIAACILQDPDRAVNSTIGRLAADAGVAVSSVVNFAVSLGFKGFAELKINMAQNLAGSGELERLPEALEGDPRRALRHIISAAMVSFEDTWQALGDELSQAAELLMAASRREAEMR